MIATFAWPVITRVDVWIAVVIALLIWFALAACKVRLPDPGIVQAYATICNTKGGIIMLLLSLWVGTLVLITAFSAWVLIRGIDPQNSVVITLLGVFIGTAFGTVNGALFKTMTGEDPKPTPGTTETTTRSSSTTPKPPAPAVAAPIAEAEPQAAVAAAVDSSTMRLP